MAELDQRSKEHKEREQWCQLKLQLDYTVSKSLFYQKKFSNFESINSIEDFKKLPITTKDDLSRNNNDFLAIPEDQVIDFVTTSGTIGKPISFALNEADLQRLALNEKCSFQTVGLTAKDKVQITTTLDRRFMAGLAYFLGLRSLGAGIIRVGSGLPALQWESIERFKPTYLVAVPSFLLKLAQYALDNGIDLNQTSVKGAICIGEPLRNEHQERNALALKINELWDIELFSTYASTEMSTAFTECEFHNGNHEQPNLIYTEILNNEGQPVKPGEIGELVVTPLGVQTMPLIRFATGDMVKELPGDCDCGNTSKRISSVVGRKQQMLKIKGTSIYPQQCYDILDKVENLPIYLLKVDTDDTHSEVLTVILPIELLTEKVISITEDMQSHLRIKPIIEQLPIEAIEQLRFSKAHRKPIKFLDLRE